MLRAIARVIVDIGFVGWSKHEVRLKFSLKLTKFAMLFSVFHLRVFFTHQHRRRLGPGFVGQKIMDLGYKLKKCV